MRLLSSLLVALALDWGVGVADHAVAKPDGGEPRPSPGDATQSEEERSLEPRDAGEHAVILEDETYRRDVNYRETEVGRHVRAKIFTNEGRELANVEIPTVAEYTTLKSWWGRTILPDGTALELRREDLARKKILEAGGLTVEAIKAALPGVVPGAVIDYGYTLRTLPLPFERIAIQRPHRVVSMRYRWRPHDELPASYRLAHGEGRDVRVEREGTTVVLTASDVPALREEPLMPPVSEVQTSIYLYYSYPWAARDDYWDWTARGEDFRTAYFNRSKGALRAVIREMGLPSDAPLEARVEKAYDWLTANVRRSDLRSAEEIEASGEDEKEIALRAKRVLRDREGTAFDLDRLFVGIARELGAEAYLAYAPDRTRNYWDPALRTLSQFAGTLVVVRTPGAPPSAATICDPGSGLPFGDVPWYYTGVPAFVATEKKAESMQIPPSAPGRNLSTTYGDVRFAEGNDVTIAKWRRTGKGQHGLDERRRLRDLPPGDRDDRIRELCGHGRGTEVLSSRAPGLDDPFGPLLLECESEREPEGLDGGSERYDLPIWGPWFEPVPEAFDAMRTYPVVFRYPHADLATMTFAPPDGYVAGELPAPVVRRADVGEYTLTFETAGKGVSVSRSFVLKVLAVPPEQYDGLRSFLTEVRKADLGVITFRREEDRP